MKTKKNITKKNKSKRFTKKDYSSNDGMLTTVWGPGLWHALHTMSFNYPVHPTNDDKKHYFPSLVPKPLVDEIIEWM